MHSHPYIRTQVYIHIHVPMLPPMTPRAETVAEPPLDPSFGHIPRQRCLRKLTQDGNKPVHLLTPVPPYTYGLGRFGPVGVPGHAQTPLPGEEPQHWLTRLQLKGNTLASNQDQHSQVLAGKHVTPLPHPATPPSRLRAFSCHKKPCFRLCF